MPFASPGGFQDPDAAAARWTRRLAAGGALLAALVLTTQTYLDMLDHGHDLWRLFLWQLGCWAFWGLLAPWVLWRGAALEEATRPRLLAEAPVALGLIASHVVLSGLVSWLVQPFVPVDTMSLSDSLRGQLYRFLLIDLFLYGLLLAAGYALGAHRRVRRVELRQAKLEADLARAQLEALRLELQPHFLFNTLHSVAALVRQDKAPAALDMLLGFAELLRSTLEGAQRPTLPLGEEVALLRRYLDLQQARLGERLEVGWHVDPDCLPVPVPTLLLQPLVENALRHGIGRRARGGRLELSARREGALLRLSVADDGAGLPADFDLTRDAGTGLANTRSRLAQLAGDLELRRRLAGGTEVVVTLPLPATAEAVA